MPEATSSKYPHISTHRIRRFSKDYPVKEVSDMDAESYWELFCMTGEPLAYMLYRAAEEEELPPAVQ